MGSFEKNEQRQRQKQILFEDDNKKSKSNGNGKSNGKMRGGLHFVQDDANLWRQKEKAAG